mmetsp:Transcript_20820/g.28943  ORF Transcript_20820/g.28943 Transcript_20820/m.28943 type:complete len:81 (+) Transcript_20820:147-389(+)
MFYQRKMKNESLEKNNSRPGLTRKDSYSTLEALAITKALEKRGFVRPRRDSLDLAGEDGYYVPRAEHPLITKMIESKQRS